MPLRRKLLLSLVVPVLILGAVGILGVSSLYRLTGSASEILSDNYRSIQDARRMERALREVERVAFAEPSPGMAPPLEEVLASFEEALVRCENNVTEIGEDETLRVLRKDWQHMATRLRSSHGGLYPEVFGLYSRIDALIDMNEQAMFRHEQRTIHGAGIAVLLLAVALVAALFSLAVFAFVTANRIARPVLEVAEDLHNTLKPVHLAQEPSARPGDEIARLRAELRNLLERLALHTDEEQEKLRRLQERLALVADEVQEGIVVADAKERVLMANRVGRQILSVTAQGSPEASLRQLVLPGEATNALASALDAGMMGRRQLPECRLPINGSEQIFRPRIIPIVAQDKRLDGFLVVFWDVTEERRMEESRQSFIAMLSHQLKTPVTSLSMSVNLINERVRGKDAGADELLAIASDDCVSLAALVNELVDAARDMTAGLSFKVRRVDVTRLLREALRPFAPQAREHDVTLYDRLGDVPVFVNADPVKLPWVITNIVGNALRYTNPGGAIEVALAVQGRWAELSVRDSGSGMSRQDLQRIFEPYPFSENEVQPGLHGLGLIIAKEIIEAHHGSIEVESEVGKGTKFHIRLPQAPGGQ